MSTDNQPDNTSSAGDGAASANGAVSPAEVMAALGEDAPSPLRTLLSQAGRACYAEQDYLYHQGGDSDIVFFVTEGLLKLVAHLPNGRARIVRLHRPGSVLGLSGLLGHNNDHTAVAVTPVTVLRLPVGAVQRLRSEDAATYAVLVERWHNYLQEADTWITEFSTGPVRGRLARLLGFLADFEPEAVDGQVRLLTCEEMGSILGVTSESVSRILAEFKRQRLLARSDKEPNELYQADVERLRDIAEED